MVKVKTDTEKPSSFTENFLEEMRTILFKKQNDYTGGSSWDRNFRFGGQRGILNRMNDKFCRLQSFLSDTEMQVEDESFRDACVDLANYTLLLARAHEEGLSVKGEGWE